MVEFKWDKNLIYETVSFAEKVHKGQTSKRQNDIPFSCHFVNVMLNTLNFLTEKDDVDYTFLIQVALLHDTIEDAGVTHALLVEKFGIRVADAVSALSRNETIEYNLQIRDCINRINKPLVYTE